MDNLTPTSILSLLETNKSQRQSFISNLIDSIENGNVDPLKVHFQVKCIEKILEELTNQDEKKNKDGWQIAKRYRAAVLSAAEAYGQKEFEFNGSKVKISETGTKYDYSQCNDAELSQWQTEMEFLKAKIDNRQKMLQTVSEKGMIITNEETGETNTVYPPSKSSTTFITMSIK